MSEHSNDERPGRTNDPARVDASPAEVAGSAGQPGGPGTTPGATLGAGLGEQTRAVHLPEIDAGPRPVMGAAVWRTSVWTFPTSAEYSAALQPGGERYVYGRNANPTVDAFASAVAALESAGLPDAEESDAVGPGAATRGGPVGAEAFGSGMAAVAAVLLAHLRPGDHVVAPREIYGGTYGMLLGLLAEFGVTTTLVDGTDPAAVAAAVAPNTRVVWAETLANPTMSVADLPALAAAAHAGGRRRVGGEWAPGALLIVDSTFATPAVCRPLQHGADLVVHSATKAIGGHSDAMGGVVVGRADVLAPVTGVRVLTGGILAPDEAFLLRRGLATLPLRVDRQCANALAMARAAAAHPAVARVDHPGLPEHRDHALATRLFDAGPHGTRFGGVLTVTPHGGRAAGERFADALRLIGIGPSLGGAHTLAGHVASTSHRQFDDAALAAAGIDAGAVRIAAGLEDAADLVADLVAALDALR